MPNLPAHGAIVVFNRVPRGSYAAPGEAYRVEHRSPRADVYLTSLRTGAGTMDRPWTYRDASWRPVA
jgi:hypothetical protein